MAIETKRLPEMVTTQFGIQSIGLVPETLFRIVELMPTGWWFTHADVSYGTREKAVQAAIEWQERADQEAFEACHPAD